MLKSFLAIAIMLAGAGVANADTHPLFTGKTDSGWTEEDVGVRWARYIEVAGEIVRVDYMITDEGSGYTVRRDCGDGKETSFGVIKAGAAVGFIADCGDKPTDYTFELKKFVDQAGMPEIK